MTSHRPSRLLLVLAALWVVAGAAVTARAEQVGTVAEISGGGEVQRQGETAWSPLRVGDGVRVGDQLRTLADGRMRIVLREESSLTLAPGSQLVITEQMLAPATVSRFELLLGTIKAAVTERYAEPRARFEVETPTAIAGVRGTSFIAEYDAAQDETLIVGVENVTRVRGRQDPIGRGEVDVSPGRATRIRRGSRPSAPEVLSASRFRRLQGMTQMAPPAGEGGRRRENRQDARRPQRGGQRAFSAEERAVDQPNYTPRGTKPPPPPPPVPPGR